MLRPHRHLSGFNTTGIVSPSVLLERQISPNTQIEDWAVTMLQGTNKISLCIQGTNKISLCIQGTNKISLCILRINLNHSGGKALPLTRVAIRVHNTGTLIELFVLRHNIPGSICFQI